MFQYWVEWVEGAKLCNSFPLQEIAQMFVQVSYIDIINKGFLHNM